MRYYHAKPDEWPMTTTETIFQTVEINKRISKEELSVTIPAGTLTVDRQQSLVYVMGKDGNPSPDQPISPIPNPGVAQIEPASGRHWAWVWWVGCAGLGCILILVALGIMRKRRARPTT
jgi:hypothetical protein